MISERDLRRIAQVIDEWPRLPPSQQTKFNDLCVELEEAARTPTSTLSPEARAHIRKMVDAAPPLTEQQKDELRALLQQHSPRAKVPQTKEAQYELLRQRTKNWPPLTERQQDTLASVLGLASHRGDRATRRPVPSRRTGRRP